MAEAKEKLPVIVTKEEVHIFADFCVYARSVYRYNVLLYVDNSDANFALMEKVAGILFGDLSKILREYVILQVCKITDPAEDYRGNKNHTAAFFLKYGDFSAAPAQFARLTEVAAAMDEFGKKLRPARNKIISHLDRDAILAEEALGAAPMDEWDQFWLHLQEFVHVLHDHYFQQPLDINSAAETSDPHMLLKALQHSDHFDAMVMGQDRKIAEQALALAFGKS